MYATTCVLAAILSAASLTARAAANVQEDHEHPCRYLPGDAGWPTDKDWQDLNRTIGGRLIRGSPLAKSCYEPNLNASTCGQVREGWVNTQIYYENPVNVMSPYWLNDSCSPLETANGSCTLGNIASYAIDVDNAETVAAGLLFAREKNIRLSIKNTGHDYIGRSNGKGSLALWTHNLNDISFFNYSSPGYTGPAAKLGAGVQAVNVYQAAAENGLRVVGGFCPSVGLAGGYVQSGGHGPLGATYGLGADNTLEFEVVTPDGRHLNVSSTNYPDLYWALSGGGAGNFAVVLSVTTKAHVDGPTAGGALLFNNTNPDAFWAAVTAWQKHLLVFDNIPGLSTSWGFSNQSFSLSMATLPDAKESDIKAALGPFIQEVNQLNLSTEYQTTEKSSFYDHYEHYSFPPVVYETNNTLGGWLISRSTVQNNLTNMIDIYREIVTDPTVPISEVNAIANNMTHARVGNGPGFNAVLPAWRDSLYTVNVGIGFSPYISPQKLEEFQAKANLWQNWLKALAPEGGGYMNEATFDDPDWKVDYFGENYNRLLSIKMKYDPNFALWQHTSVGADAYWEVAKDGRLCLASLES